MEFSSWQEFIAMGQHGFYVWLSYGFTAMVVLANIIQPIIRRNKIAKDYSKNQRRQAAQAALQVSSEPK